MSSGEVEDVCKDGADVAALFRAGEYRRKKDKEEMHARGKGFGSVLRLGLLR